MAVDIPASQTDRYDTKKDGSKNSKSVHHGGDGAGGGRGGGEGEPRGARAIISSWAESSSCNGIPHTVGRGGTLRKLCWGALVLTGTVLTVWQVCQSIQKYLTYPYNIAVSIDFLVGMEFPAVTICNTNQIRKSALPELQPILESVFPQQYGLQSSYNQATTAGRAMTRERFDRVWALVNDSVKVKAGHQINGTLLDCIFDGTSCGAENFTLILNAVHGNCFTFNSGALQSQWLKAYKPGPPYGLTLELFLDQADYIPELTDHAGMKILVHHQEAMPFPEDAGFMAPPGFYTLVNTRQNAVHRLPAPYPSRCVHLEPQDALLQNVYSQLVPYVDYSLQGCKKTCYQATVISECKCGDPHYPLEGAGVRKLLDHNQKNQSIKPCSTDLEEMCEGRIINLSRNNKLECDCPMPCRDIVYLTSESLSDWPILAVQEQYYKALAERHPNIAYIFNSSSSSDLPRANLVKVSIFFEELNREVIKETKAMTPSSLFSAIGGIFGFYLGLSIVAMFEFAELITDLLRICVSKINRTHTK